MLHKRRALHQRAKAVHLHLKGKNVPILTDWAKGQRSHLCQMGKTTSEQRGLPHSRKVVGSISSYNRVELMRSSRVGFLQVHQHKLGWPTAAAHDWPPIGLFLNPGSSFQPPGRPRHLKKQTSQHEITETVSVQMCGAPSVLIISHTAVADRYFHAGHQGTHGNHGEVPSAHLPHSNI